MKKIEELKSVIRTLIREEAKKIVAEEVNKAMGKVLVEMVKEIKSTSSVSPIVENKSAASSQTTKTTILKTNNPKLNSVLAETAKNFKPLKKTNDTISNMATILDDFRKVGDNESLDIDTPSVPSTNLDFLKQMVTPEMPSQPSVLDTDDIPDVLQNVFKKDFRQTMKKIDAAAKTLTLPMI